MPLDTRQSREAVCAGVDAKLALADGGTLAIYAGERPPYADSPADESYRLATLRLGTPAFQPAIDGQAVSYPISPDLDCGQTGDATWYRVYKADGVSPLFDGTVGVADAGIRVATPHFVQHARIVVMRLAYREPKQAGE